MWFFDSVLEEKSSISVVSAPVAKDEQDGSFLIIDDSVSAESIPDTALQLFDATPVATINAQETALVSEVSFFSEPAVSQVESPEVVSEAIKSSSPEVAFFDALVESAETDTVVEMSIREPLIEVSMKEGIVEEESVINTASIPEKNDIYAPIKRAIAEYDMILVAHTQIAEAKDTEISEYNNQVAVAKAAAKKALEERKALETEMDRVKQMKELFSLQLMK